MDSYGGGSLAEVQLYALVEVAAGAAGAHRLEDVLELAAERALTATGAASLSISRWEAGDVVTLINVGELGPAEERFPLEERYPLSQFPTTLRVLTGGGMMVAAVDDPSSDAAHRELLRELDKETSLTVPIVFEDETWGELWATSAAGEPRFIKRDGLFMRAIADQVAAAIGRAELFAQVEALAYTDPLTSLANRRVLEAALERACDRSPGGGSPALLLCDVDGLKAINDGYGHDAGDRVILRVAAVLTEAAAPYADAVVSRIGGDEFCVLLPSGDADAAHRVCRDAAARLSVCDPGEAAISSGIAALAPEHNGPADLLRAADLAQYKAKGACSELPDQIVRPSSADGPQPALDRALGGRSSARREHADELLAMLAAHHSTDADELLTLLRCRLATEARRPRG